MNNTKLDMTHPTNRPSAIDFRHGSTDRAIIQMLEQGERYGLIRNWVRIVGADKKPTYTVVLADGEMEQALRPQQAAWMLRGMIAAHRLHAHAAIIDSTQRLR